MKIRIRTAVVVLALAPIGLAGCVAQSAPAPSTPASSGPAHSGAASVTETPAAAPTPNREDPAQLSIVRLNPDGKDAFTESTTGPALMSSGVPVRIDGWCRGGSVAYSLVTASVDVERRTLTAGTFPCGDALQSNRSAGIDYEGPVQLLVEADDVVEGWVQVLQPGA